MVSSLRSSNTSTLTPSTEASEAPFSTNRAGTRRLPGSLIRTRAELIASPTIRPALAAATADWAAVTTVTSERKKRGSGRLLWIPPSKFAVVNPSARMSTRCAASIAPGSTSSQAMRPRRCWRASATEAAAIRRSRSGPISARAPPPMKTIRLAVHPLADDRRSECLERPRCELAASQRHAQAAAHCRIELGDDRQRHIPPPPASR